MQFNTIEARFHGIAGCCRIFAHDLLNLAEPQSSRNFVILRTRQSEVLLPLNGNGRWGNRELSTLDQAVTHSPRMPKLGINHSTPCMNGLGDLLPSLDLSTCEQPWRERATHRLLTDIDGLTHDQSSAGTLRIIEHCGVLNHTLSGSPGSSHRGHGHSV